MKKILVCILLFVMCLPFAYADDLGIQIIGGGSFNEMQSLDFDDIQIGESYEIGGFAKITPTDFGYYDSFA